MTNRYVMPKGALILILIGLVPSVLTALGLFDIPYGMEVVIAGGALAGAGILWHLVARFRYRMARAGQAQPPR